MLIKFGPYLEKTFNGFKMSDVFLISIKSKKAISDIDSFLHLDFLLKSLSESCFCPKEITNSPSLSYKKPDSICLYHLNNASVAIICVVNILINLHVLLQPQSLHQLLEVGSDMNKLICQVYITPV